MGTGKLIWKYSPIVLLLFLLTSSVVEPHSQPLINQLAVLLRARPPWPTMFPPSTNSNTNPNTNTNSNSNLNALNALFDQQSESSNSPFSMDNLQLQDFSHLNNLIAAQTLGAQEELQPNQYQQVQQVDQHGQKHSNFVQQLYPMPTAETAAAILKAHQQAVAAANPSKNGKNGGTGNGDTKGILIAHPVLGPNQFNQQNMDNKMQNLQNFKNFQQLQNLQSFQNVGLKHQQVSGSGDNSIVAAINTGGFYIGPSQPSSEGIQIIKSQLPPPIHHHLHPNQRPITFINGKPPPGGRVIAIPIPSNTPFLLPHRHSHNNNINQYQQTSSNYQQLQQQPNLVTSGPQFISSNLISTSKFNPSYTDSSVQTTIVTAPPTTMSPSTGTTPQVTTTFSTTTSATTTTLGTTTRPMTMTTTTTKRPSRNPQPHFVSSYSKGTTLLPRPTIPSLPQTNHINNIREVIQQNSQNQQQVLVSSPSTLVGSFRYPDPPTPPNFQSMNTRYELQNQDVLKSYWTSKKHHHDPTTFTNTKAPTGNGFYESSVSNVSPSFNSITASVGTSSGTGSKLKHETDNIVQSSQYEIAKDFETFDTNFRPSLQLHSFEDSTSGLKEYITINPPPSKRDSKSLLFSPPKSSSTPHHFKPTEAKDLPSMESGFRPFNHYAFVNGVPGASITTTTQASVLNLIRNEFTKDYGKSLPWSNPDPTGQTGPRQERKYLDSSRGIENTYSFYSKNENNNNKPPTLSPPGVSLKTYDDRYVTSTPAVASDSWKGRLASGGGTGSSSGLYNHRHVTTASSELFEDWLTPTGKPYYRPETTTTTKPPTFGHLGESKNPLECEKFYRFGFCPVTSHYPLEQVESIGSRCSTLLSHLIAPLPKTDVRYDIIVPKNGSHVKGRSAAPTGWSWKTFAGKPVCDTKEVKIVPGWAKNEQGDWLVILQTQNWKQEAQISLCTSQGDHCDRSTGRNCEVQKAKCVQRFTAQRLVVLDPLNQDRCPVVRSVFLPSACVCLSNEVNEGTGDLRPPNHRKSKRQSKASEMFSQGHGGGNEGGYSKVATGRSLSTSFFNFGLEDVDLDTAADSSTSGEKAVISGNLSPNSDSTGFPRNNHNNINTNKASSEEGDVPVISVPNPANASSFMVITEKVTGGEITNSSSTESFELLPQRGAFVNPVGNTSSSSPIVTSFFVVSSSSSGESGETLNSSSITDSNP